MKITIRNFIVILIFLSFFSCDILDSDSSSLSPLDTKIDFKVIESYDNYESVSTPKIFIELKSEKIYGCFNYTIVSAYKIDNKTIEINVLGINKPNICLTALGPATGRIKLGELYGNYEIVIQGNGFANNYNLVISDSLIMLDGKETQHTKPLINSIYRYPKNSFAYLCGTTLSNNSICSGFIDTLKSVIDLNEFSFSDIAEIPYPKSSQGHQYDAIARYFYYKNEDEFNRIEDVMRSYIKNNFSENGATLEVINWMNKKVRSWLL